jgi:serine kinase of HPr protein (carbohydrate metabolism regulator)
VDQIAIQALRKNHGLIGDARVFFHHQIGKRCFKKTGLGFGRTAANCINN